MTIDLSALETYNDSGRRSITTTYVLGPQRPESERDDGRTVQTVVKVVTNHHGRAEYMGRPDKCYITTASQLELTFRDGRQSGWKAGMYDGKTVMLHREDAARFSDAGLWRAHGVGQLKLAEALDDPRVVAIFTA